MTSRRSLRQIVRPIADRHDWLHDQSQIATTGCTTNRRSPRLVARPSQIATTGCMSNRRLPRLVARPIADCHDWLHDQSQITNAVCTTNCRYKKRRLGLGSEESTPLWHWGHLKDWSSCCSTCIGWYGLCWGLHGLCWGFARPLLACPVQEEPDGYLHLHSLAFGSHFFCIWR